MGIVLIVCKESDGIVADVERLGWQAESVNTAKDAQNFVSDRDVAAVVLKLKPLEESLAIVEQLREQNPPLPLIVISEDDVAGAIVSAIKRGASDYLIEPAGADAVRKALQNAIDESSQAFRVTEVVAETLTSGNWSEKAEFLTEMVAGTEVPVLLLGETGVGKEVMARRLHQRSSRAGRPFLKLNCAALPSELVESELFGYERGAFTGAFRRTPGKFEMADGGTILLDEIGEMDFKLQAKLLQVLQDHEFHRLGSSEPTKVDVRVMAATHRDLQAAIVAGRFREDLYFRLNIVEIHIPPLRQRRGEILQLAEHFLQKYGTFRDAPVSLPPTLREAFLDYSWPGNIRELENIVRRYLVLKDPAAIAEYLKHAREERGVSLRISPSRAQELNPAPPRGVADLESVSNAHKAAEIETILAALTSTRWNRRKAAALLNIDYKALLYRMNKLGIGADEAAG